MGVLGAVMLGVIGCFQPAEQPIVMEPNAVLLDVRSAEEFATGHLKGAVLLPHDVAPLMVAERIAAKDTPIYLYCRSGRRSALTAEALKNQGYTDTHDLGGLPNAQRLLNLPITPSPAE